MAEARKDTNSPTPSPFGDEIIEFADTADADSLADSIHQAVLESSKKDRPTKHVKSRRKGRPKPRLCEEQILEWADAHHKQTGRWPNTTCGKVSESPTEIWKTLDQALRAGRHGLAGGASLASLRGASRGVPNPRYPPRLNVDQILRQAKDYHDRTGKWPSPKSGPLPETPRDTWKTVHHALKAGLRGLERCAGLATFLNSHFGPRNASRSGPLTIDNILMWADACFRENGKWPTAGSGYVQGAPGQTWLAVSAALRNGSRGLEGGSSLSNLLALCRGKHNPNNHPLVIDEVLEWADAFRARTGNWPTKASGIVAGHEHETWANVDDALRSGCRGLPGGLSLARLLFDQRNANTMVSGRILTQEQILEWADQFRERTGKWPTRDSQIPVNDRGYSWSQIDTSLRDGNLGLKPGGSLARLLAKHRGAYNRKGRPTLTEQQIIAWAMAYHTKTGSWPTQKSGPIEGQPYESWNSIICALYGGLRGLPHRTTLARLLAGEDPGLSEVADDKTNWRLASR